MNDTSYDAVVIGSGPNGLAAAVAIAQAGRSVLVIEKADTVGGGCRSKELTEPGSIHDVCSAVHPLGMASPFFKTLPLQDHGLTWIQPDAPVAHPIEDSAIVFERSLEATSNQMDMDAESYRRLMSPLVRNTEGLIDDLVGPFPFPPKHPIAMAQFGLTALRSASAVAKARFKGPRAKAAFAGLAAHSMQPLSATPTAAFGLTLGFLAHGVGWPIPKGGSQKIADSLAAHLKSLGGEIQTGWDVTSMAEIPDARAYLFDLTPRQIVAIASDQLPARYVERLGRYRYGTGVFKIDWSLNAPIPWIDERVGRAGTVHVGGTFEEIAASEEAPWQGKHHAKPFVLLAQPSIADPTRAPAGKHTAWAYCHVPSGSTVDMSDAIESQVERFAPGFRDVVSARATMNTEQVQAYNPNYVGGDINAGVQDLRQLFTRPVARLNPYTTPNERLFICSASTPPGGGVHGMCGFYAAKAVLKRRLK